MTRAALTAKQTAAIEAIKAGEWFRVTDRRTINSLERRGLVTVDRELRGWYDQLQRARYWNEIIGMTLA